MLSSGSSVHKGRFFRVILSRSKDTYWWLPPMRTPIALYSPKLWWQLWGKCFNLFWIKDTLTCCNAVEILNISMVISWVWFQCNSGPQYCAALSIRDVMVKYWDKRITEYSKWIFVAITTERPCRSTRVVFKKALLNLNIGLGSGRHGGRFHLISVVKVESNETQTNIKEERKKAGETEGQSGRDGREIQYATSGDQRCRVLLD